MIRPLASHTPTPVTRSASRQPKVAAEPAGLAETFTASAGVKLSAHAWKTASAAAFGAGGNCAIRADFPRGYAAREV